MGTKRKLTADERWRLKASRELLRGPFEHWPEMRETYLAEIEAGEAFHFWSPGEASREAFERCDRIYEAAVRNVEMLGGGRVRLTTTSDEP